MLFAGAKASTRAAGLPAGDDGRVGVELSQAPSTHATASAIAASLEDADILHSFGRTACERTG